MYIDVDLSVRSYMPWMTPKTIAHTRWTADLLDIQQEDRVIEIGFGNGANIQLLLKRAIKGSVIGAEISTTAIETASKKSVKAISQGRVKLHQAPGFPLKIMCLTRHALWLRHM